MTVEREGDTPGGDLVVDVLVVGAGLQGLYLAQALVPEYSVCVLADPTAPSESLEWTGHVSAGYEGNDAARMQPARRAAGFWHLWAESNEVPHGYSPSYVVLPETEVPSRVGLWTAAALTHERVDELPAVFAGGQLDGGVTFRLNDDVVMNPAAALTSLSDGLGAVCVEGRVLRFGVFEDRVVDHVQIEVEGRVVPVLPRFVVLAAGVGNAALLDMIAKRFVDQAARLEHLETARASQAVLRVPVVCVRGDLPLLSGWFGGLSIVAQPMTGSEDVVWLVSAPADPSATVVGLDDTRFEPNAGPRALADAVTRLFAVAPELSSRAGSLQWGGYVSRRVQHPVVAGRSPERVATPVPAKLESFGLDGFLALWPSHPGYSMVLGEVVAERVTAAIDEQLDAEYEARRYARWDADPRELLEELLEDEEGLRVAELAAERPRYVSRWERPDFEWDDWQAFAARHGIEPG